MLVGRTRRIIMFKNINLKGRSGSKLSSIVVLLALFGHGAMANEASDTLKTYNEKIFNCVLAGHEAGKNVNISGEMEFFASQAQRALEMCLFVSNAKQISTQEIKVFLYGKILILDKIDIRIRGF
jgi:hypothetical protein